MLLEGTMKVFKSGNSNAIRLNKKIVEALNLSTGSELQFDLDMTDGTLTLKPVPQTSGTHSNVPTPEFKAKFDQLYGENREAMDLLKDL